MPSLPTLPSLSSLPLLSSLPTLSPTGVETIKELSSFLFLSFYFVAACMQPLRCNHPSPPPTGPSPPPARPLPSPARPLPSSASEEEEDVGAVRVRVPLISITFVEEDYEDIGDEEVAEENDGAGNEKVGEEAVEHVTDNDKDDAVVDLINQFARLSVFDTMDHLAERFSLILLLDEDIVMVRAPPLGPEHMVVDQRWPAPPQEANIKKQDTVQMEWSVSFIAAKSAYHPASSKAIVVIYI
ncbi:hypothetical protein BJV82DRAFT_700414 [Fennellomyces sp. T-0311]|nr:hypothetical protein BJV82DRAFT_700414 [Fennellomyces sp. T-0311]